MTAPPTRRPRLLRPDEGDALWFLGGLVTVKATGADTGGRVTVVEFRSPPGFAPPLHRHTVEDEMFLLLGGRATFLCDGQRLVAGPGDFVLLPAGLAHSFLVAPDEPLHTLQITTPSGFEQFAAAVGGPAGARRLPEPGPVDPAALAHAAQLHGVEILGPPPGPEL
ncbi:cupin domain-containing protein [Trujillonella humicola]|uniref:cupin domain-containing protein n=1 Tax=Trujillonella humicola TaxID=3383699 RepID=UPI00390578A1